MPITVPLSISEVHTTGATSLAMSFGSLPNPGDMVVVTITNFKNPAHTILNTELSDNQGGGSGKYTVDLQIPSGAGTQVGAICSRVNIGASSGTFTVTYTTNPSESIEITLAGIAVRGIATQATTDKTVTNTGSISTVTTGSTSVIDKGDEISIAMFNVDMTSSPATISDPSGYTSIFKQGDFTFCTGAAHYQIQTSVAAQSVSWSCTGVSIVGWGAGICTYKGFGVSIPLGHLKPAPFKSGRN